MEQANILVDDNLCIKLGDFGLSTFIDSSTLSSGTHPGGTVRWGRGGCGALDKPLLFDLDVKKIDSSG